jgi:Ca2+/H+ antiporter
MGTAYLVGGVKYSQQSFNTLQTHTGAGLLVLAVMCMLLPAVLDATNTEAINGVSSTTLSRVVSIIMILTYVALMVFQLKTHAYLFDAIENGEPTTPTPRPHGVVHSHISGAAVPSSSSSAGTGGGHQSMASAAAAAIESGIKASSYSSLPDRSGSVASEDASTSAATTASAATGAAAAAAATGVAAGVGDGDEAKEDEEKEDEEDEEPPLSIVSSVFWMAVVAGLIAVLSEILVGSIEAFASASGAWCRRGEVGERWWVGGGARGSRVRAHTRCVFAFLPSPTRSAGIPDAFASTILLPIAGNAAEHASAIMFAAKNRLDISLGVAVGSSIQIALFVTPFCVLVRCCASGGSGGARLTGWGVSAARGARSPWRAQHPAHLRPLSLLPAPPPRLTPPPLLLRRWAGRWASRWTSTSRCLRRSSCL